MNIKQMIEKYMGKNLEEATREELVGSIEELAKKKTVLSIPEIHEKGLWYIYVMHFKEEPLKIHIGHTNNYMEKKRIHLQALREDNHMNDELTLLYQKYGAESLVIEPLPETASLNRDQLDAQKIEVTSRYENTHQLMRFTIRDRDAV